MSSRSLVRCGIVLGFVDSDDAQYRFVFGIDATYHQITELAGSRKEREDPVHAAWRETREESLNIFPRGNDTGDVVAYIEVAHGCILGALQRIYVIMLRERYSAREIVATYAQLHQSQDELSALLPLTIDDLLRLYHPLTDGQWSEAVNTLLEPPPHFYTPTRSTVGKLLELLTTDAL